MQTIVTFDRKLATILNQKHLIAIRASMRVNYKHSDERGRLAREWPPIPPRRGMQSIGGRWTNSQQHQFQEPSQPQHSRPNKFSFQGPACVRAPRKHNPLSYIQRARPFPRELQNSKAARPVMGSGGFAISPYVPCPCPRSLTQHRLGCRNGSGAG